MKLLKYQSSTETILIGPVIKSTDGYSRSTALTLTTAPAIRLSKVGSTLVNRNDTGAVSIRYGGFYSVPLSTVDTGTYGHLRVTLQTSAARLPYWEDYFVCSTETKQFLQNNILEGTYTYEDAERIKFSVLAGKSTGAGSTTLKFRGVAASTVDRVNASVGSSGNRQAVTLKSSS
jgi:hypothetical protein